MDVVEEMKGWGGAILLALIIYKSLSIAFATPMPVVTVVSDSMVPIINRGDLLLVTSPKNAKIGDIVVYKVSVMGNIPIVHRLIGKETVNGKEYWVIKGDNNPSSDPWLITDDNIVGKVVLDFPLLGYPRMLLYRLLGF